MTIGHCDTFTHSPTVSYFPIGTSLLPFLKSQRRRTFSLALHKRRVGALSHSIHVPLFWAPVVPSTFEWVGTGTRWVGCEVSFQTCFSKFLSEIPLQGGPFSRIQPFVDNKLSRCVAKRQSSKPRESSRMQRCGRVRLQAKILKFFFSKISRSTKNFFGRGHSPTIPQQLLKVSRKLAQPSVRS